MSIVKDIMPPEREANQPVSRILGAINRESNLEVLSFLRSAIILDSYEALERLYIVE